MSNVTRLNVPGTPREHVHISIEDLAAELAKAHDVGYRGALTDANIDPLTRSRLVNELWSMSEMRARFYEAMLQGMFAKG